MARTGIDFGIDLGTTNSAIAVLNGAELQVVKNNRNLEFTPSAVWISPGGEVRVGPDAKPRLESDPDNAAGRFKLQMGTDWRRTFARSDRPWSPEELSAEILKSLRRDVSDRLGEEISAAVITVPAAFGLAQNEATMRAARLAGFEQAVLLQEPVAAAHAYVFQSRASGGTWLIYDIGGGTFDAALVRVSQGEIRYLDHAGDENLGGKLIDDALVREHFVPAFNRANPSAGLEPGARQWLRVMAGLTESAEEAKIALSRQDSLTAYPELRDYELEVKLERADVERAAEPIVTRSLNICRALLDKHQLKAGQIERVVLVGGPTLMPYLRQRLADPQSGLGITLDYTVDPLTVVARGAAIRASQIQRFREAPKPPTGGFAIRLEYQPRGREQEPLVAGLVEGPGGSLAGHTIRFTNNSAVPAWDGVVGLAENGAFQTMVRATVEGTNRFEITLSDPTGGARGVEPACFEYDYQPEDSTAVHVPLTHSVGARLAGNRVTWIVKKGDRLPARGKQKLLTTVEVRPAQGGGEVRIPILEGEHERADRNREVGALVIPGSEIKHRLPINSQIELQLVVDESRQVSSWAYVPDLDQEFEGVMHLEQRAAPPLERLRRDFQEEQARLVTLRKQAEETGDARARAILERLDAEQMVGSVTTALAEAAGSRERADLAELRLLQLKVALDEAEQVLKWPALVAEAERALTNTRAWITEHGNSEDARKSAALEREIRSGIESRDEQVLRDRVQQMWALAETVLGRKGISQAWWFQHLQDRKAEMVDQGRAEALISQGLRALNAGDHIGVDAVNRELAKLLPLPPRTDDPSHVTL